MQGKCANANVEKETDCAELAIFNAMTESKVHQTIRLFREIGRDWIPDGPWAWSSRLQGFVSPAYPEIRVAHTDLRRTQPAAGDEIAGARGRWLVPVGVADFETARIAFAELTSSHSGGSLRFSSETLLSGGSLGLGNGFLSVRFGVNLVELLSN